VSTPRTLSSDVRGPGNGSVEAVREVAVVERGTRIGPYEVLSLVGAGGMGEVYRARDPRLERDVAIKVLPAAAASNAERLRRFEREARATAALTHPNILDVHDVGTHEGVPYLVEELLEGESLHERLGRGPVPLAEAVEIALQVARGLAAAHDKHIVHRDLKPGNVFITNDGTVKILDFGLAKLVEALPACDAETLTDEPTGLTDAGRVLGTVSYMAPEQACGRPVDARTDLFALGVLLYEMLAGQRPFRGETARDTVAAILTQEPAKLPETVPPGLQQLVSRCLAKRPEERFASAHDLVRAFQSHAGSGSETAPRALAANRRRSRFGAAALVCAAVLIALSVWRPWRPDSKPAVNRAAERIPSILALPCKVYGAPEVAFLTDAVPATLSTLLAQVEGLDTRVPPTSLEVEKVEGDLATLAELYGVSSFIVTSVNASAGGFALNVQLVDAATRKVRWGRQYQGSQETYNELAHQAADGIRLAIDPAAAPIASPTLSSAAELALREGNYFLNRYGNLGHAADFEAGLAAYRRALASDPALAVAAAGIAQLWGVRIDAEGDLSEARQQGESWSRRALGLDPSCGEAWAALSGLELHATHADPERGIDFAVRSVVSSPRSAWTHTMLGVWLYNGASISLGLESNLRAAELDPFTLPPAGNAAFFLDVLGRPAEALALLERGLVIEPEWLFGTIIKGGVLTSLGRLEEAEGTLQSCERAAESNYLLGEMWRETRLTLAVAQGDAATAQALAAQILATILGREADAMLIANAAGTVTQVLARMGRTDDALRIFERSAEAGVQQPYDWLRLEPSFQPLRDDPRFARVLAASREMAVTTARILASARARGELPLYLEQPLDEFQKLLEEEGPKT
jgi:serine/threonine protein kinase/tetratricopeptide (TPR) repeat protein